MVALLLYIHLNPLKTEQLKKYLCCLLGHFYQGRELVSDPRQCNLLKQTLLSLSKHQANQHAEHGWTHVVAGSVGEGLLQVVQRTWGGDKRSAEFKTKLFQAKLFIWQKKNRGFFLFPV